MLTVALATRVAHFSVESCISGSGAQLQAALSMQVAIGRRFGASGDLTVRSSNATRATNVIPLRPRSHPEIAIGCEDNLAFMRKLPNESMHLIITSPAEEAFQGAEQGKGFE